MNEKFKQIYLYLIDFMKTRVYGLVNGISTLYHWALIVKPMVRYLAVKIIFIKIATR